MYFKKTFALFMVFVMLFSLCLVVEADESVEIVSPANDAMIEYSESETELVVSASVGTMLQIYLDNARLPNVVTTEEETRVSLGVLELGKHKVSVVAVFGSTAEQVESTFVVAKTVIKENYSDNFAGGNSGSLAPYSQRPSLGVDENNDNITAEYGSFEGVDGDENGSIGFRFMKTATSLNLPDGYEICYVFEPLPRDLGSKFTLEYDLMLVNPGAWDIRVGNTQNGGRRYSQLAISQFLGADGFVTGTDIEYPIGEWMHVKHVINVSEGKTGVYINDNPVLEDILVGASNLTNLEIVKFQYYATHPEGPQGFNLDNVRILSESMYYGISAVNYVAADGTEKSMPDDSVINEQTSKIIFNNDVEGFAPWERGTKFKVLADGVEVPVAAISSINETSFSVELSEPLPEKAHIEVLTEYNSIPIKTFFDTNSIDFGIYEVILRKGTTNIYSTSQIEGGDSLNGFIGVKTNLSEDKVVTAIVGVYSGNRLVSLQSKSGITVYGNTTSIKYKTLPVSIPEDIDDISIEIFLIDNFTVRKPLSYPFVFSK